MTSPNTMPHQPKTKHTPIGDIPVEWETAVLGDLVQVKHGFAFKGEHFSDTGEFIVLTPGNFLEEGGFRGRGRLDRYYKAEFPPEYLLKAGDLVVAMTEQAAGLLGSPAIIPDTGRYLHNQRLGLVSILDKARLDRDFLFRVLNTDSARRHISVTAGGTKVRHTSPRKIRSTHIPLPPLREQGEIAEILSTWDRAIEQTEKLIEVRKRRKKGLMQRLLTGEKRFPEFEGTPWRTYRIRELLKEVRRPIEWDDGALYELISVRRRSGGLFHRDSLYGRQIKTKNLRVARTGDFLISKMQVVHGAAGLTPPAFDGMKISGSYIALVARDPDALLIEYFDCLSQMPFMYHASYISSYGVHIEKMTFNLKLYLGTEISIPPTIDEQARIAAVLNTCDSEISLLRRKLAALQQQKKGLMQKLLTGKVRVSVPTGEEG